MASTLFERPTNATYLHAEVGNFIHKGGAEDSRGEEAGIGTQDEREDTTIKSEWRTEQGFVAMHGEL